MTEFDETVFHSLHEKRWIESNELPRLEWKSGQVQWEFSDKAPRLAEAIIKNGGSICIACWIYELRCNGKFIVRFRARVPKRRRITEENRKRVFGTY
jgi:hypothetical protein